MTLLEALTWPGSWTWPYLFAGSLTTAACLWLRHVEDRDVRRYRRQLEGRAALARATNQKGNSQ